MFKGLGQIPTGVWAGVVVVLAAAWIQDLWGFILGAIIIVATMVTTAYKPEEPAEEPQDDDWRPGPAKDTAIYQDPDDV